MSGTALPRVETGPVQFDDDWPGVFIRGDNALMGFAPALEALISTGPQSMDRMMCESLLGVLRSCSVREGHDGGLQRIRRSGAHEHERQREGGQDG